MAIRTIFKVFLGLTLLQYVALAKEPEIKVEDGKVSIIADGVPLGRLLTLLDRAMGTSSQVKPELAARNISVQFTDLEFDDAVRKIFQGQPLNYVVISGKGIRVTELAQGGPAISGPSVAFDPPPAAVNPFSGPLPPPLQPGAPVAGVPIPNPNQQQPAVTIFGPRPDPNAAPVTAPYPASNIPGGAALGNNPALSLSPPILGQQPAGAGQPATGMPTNTGVPLPVPGVPR